MHWRDGTNVHSPGPKGRGLPSLPLPPHNPIWLEKGLALVRRIRTAKRRGVFQKPFSLFLVLSWVGR